MAFADILGQERALSPLRRMLARRELPPALIFAGPQGVGKTKAALELAKALNCEAQSDDACGLCPSCVQADKGLSMDTQLIDAEYQARLKLKEKKGEGEPDEALGEKDLETLVAKQTDIKIDTIRHVLGTLAKSSFLGSWKIAALENAHLLNKPAANAMLKSLEEPPPRTLWILITHQDERLLPTIRSRCRRVRFGPLSEALVRRVLAEQGRQGPEADDAARLSGGSVSRALALLEGGCPEPEEWLNDPLAPFALADKLPRELHLSRPAVKEHLLRMAGRLRGGYASARVRAALREFAVLRRALDANASPQLVLTLAALTLQSVPPAERP
ncbi:MAG TPA: DNA polymerase III subunit delta' [Elusimicrobia bacterium]|nr:DNA polymerase III subunit delta' [Elusimicrobiota bacterium]